MAQEEQKFLGKLGLSQLITEIKSGFANIVHQHTKADITDLEVDTTLSSTSENPVQNNVLKMEFDAINNELSQKSQVQIVTWEADD